MQPHDNGATSAAMEISGEATRDSVQTDLQFNDGTASGGDTVDPLALPGDVLPPNDVELPGPVFNLESVSPGPEE